jgi:hypothetical protein
VGRKVKTAGLRVKDSDGVIHGRDDVVSSVERLPSGYKWEWHIDDDVPGLGLPQGGRRREQHCAQSDSNELHKLSPQIELRNGIGLLPPLGRIAGLTSNRAGGESIERRTALAELLFGSLAALLIR